uniref:RSN1_7TM domain-containing protein n=1 Tax=Angiostrongylus cantonensis TaxID=6313 RepID=A0A158P7Q7_ANGCA
LILYYSSYPVASVVLASDRSTIHNSLISLQSVFYVQITFQLAKAIRAGSEWSDKDELLDVVYWGRQVLSLIIGIAFGVTSMHGILAILAYVAISTVVAQHFVVKYQQVDEDEVGGFWELAKEGFGSAFATFMVSWITVYSAVHQNS